MYAGACDCSSLTFSSIYILNLTGLWILILSIAVVFVSLATAAPTNTTLNTIQEGSASFSNEANDVALNETRKETYDKIIIEGDIEITIEMLHKYYEQNETMEKELMHEYNVTYISKRAATSDESKLWTGRTVPFRIDGSIGAVGQLRIMDAINEWSYATCLNFVQRTSHSNFITFINDTNQCSSNIGCDGGEDGEQYIRLTNGCSQSTGIIMHEIGHALGLWHEQSRPDRDSYVTVLWENIEQSESHNFNKRLDKEVDYQGTGYDYGAIMHYSRTAFVKDGCNGCNTLDVSNMVEYNNQLQPMLGQRTGLSASDITQVNRLYKCPGSGQRGFLAVYIRYARNLEDSDGFLAGDPDPYVRVKAVSSIGSEYHTQTSKIQGTRHPNWNEWLLFSEKEWQFFRLRIWESDIFNDDIIGMSETVPLLNQPSTSTWKNHCANTDCNQYAWYDYKIIASIQGALRIKVRSAHNLPDTDGLWNDPDPYVQVKAIKPDGDFTTKVTSTKQGTRNPSWNEWLGMTGCQFTSAIMVQVMDDDLFSDDEMSDKKLIEISSSGYHTIRHCLTSSCSSYLYLDYEVIPNRCEYRLAVDVLYGRNLPDEDGLFAGDSDTYVKIVAYDYHGNSFERRTYTAQGNENPNWNQNINFGVNLWVRFVVSVWDDDTFSDDSLSGTYTRYLPSTGTAEYNNIRMNTHGNGYIVFNYSYK